MIPSFSSNDIDRSTIVIMIYDNIQYTIYNNHMILPVCCFVLCFFLCVCVCVVTVWIEKLGVAKD